MATINGDGDGNELIGTGNNDTINGKGGDDTLDGNGASDLLDGGAGNDVIYTDGSDIARGQSGIDSLQIYLITGEPVNLDMRGMSQAAALVNIGHQIRVSQFETVSVFTGAANDTVLMANVGSFANTGGGADSIVGGAGDDYVRAGAGNDTIKGGAGIDRIGFYGEAAATGATVDLRIITAQNTGAGMDVIKDIENVSGTARSDSLTGNNQANVIWGSSSNDTGRNYADTLSGEGGDDVLTDGTGKHSFYGGSGTDTVNIGTNPGDTEGAVKINLALQGVEGASQATGEGTMFFSSIENLSGTFYGDTLTGDTGANVLCGEDGNDTLKGGAGGDKLYGDGVIEGDYAFGLSGPAGLFTSHYAAFDVLEGGAGNDTLHGGGGSDILTGSKGADRFLYEATSDTQPGLSDRITDFTASQNDVLDVSAIDADVNTAGDQAFVLVEAFTGVAGQAFLLYGEGIDRTLLSFDIDGDSEADMAINFDGELTTADLSGSAFVA